MSVSGNPSVAKAAFTDRESLLPLAACPTISRSRKVYEQANAVPFAADAHVGGIARDAGMGRAAVELVVEGVGRLRLARLGGTGFVFLASVGADRAFPIHYPLYPRLGATIPSLASARFILGAPRSRRLSS